MDSRRILQGRNKRTDFDLQPIAHEKKRLGWSKDSSGPIEILLKFRSNTRQPIITYQLIIDEENEVPFVASEGLWYRRGLGKQPVVFIQFFRGQGQAATNEWQVLKNGASVKMDRLNLKSPDILAIKALGQFDKFPSAKALGDLIDNLHVEENHYNIIYRDFENSLGCKPGLAGENFSQMTHNFKQRYPQVFNKILLTLRNRIPGLDKIETFSHEDDLPFIRVSEQGFLEPFSLENLSDGTIKMLHYLLYLYHPLPHSLLCVEEPECLIYPSFLKELGDEFRHYSFRGRQVMVSTHSPDILDMMKPEEVYILLKNKGFTSVLKGKDLDYLKSSFEKGIKLGGLWRDGFFPTSTSNMVGLSSKGANIKPSRL